MSVLNLPTEVLVHIFEYVKGGDILNLSVTCKRFNEILEAKTLTRKLSFAGCYTANISHIKCYLKPKIRHENVKEFDLTSCYWLKSIDIRECVLKLSNLDSLYVADTSLTWRHLLMILNKCQLKRLSWSWNHRLDLCRTSIYMDIEFISPQLGHLEFMLVYIKTPIFGRGDLDVLCTWLVHCTALKELWVIVPEQTRSFTASSEFGLPSRQLDFPHLHTLVMSQFCCNRSDGLVNNLFSIILRGCKFNTAWHCFWIAMENLRWAGDLSVDVSEAATLVLSQIDIRSKPEDCPKLEHLSWSKGGFHQLESAFESPSQTVKKFILNSLCMKVKWDSLWSLLTNLEELNVMYCMTDIRSVCSQKNLRKLALPICIIREKEGSDSSQTSESHDIIQVVVETCPNIEEFEFTPCFRCGSENEHTCSKHQESSFVLFSKWKNLRRLKLEGLKCVRSGNFFMQIFKSCENLESISLKNLGLRGNCNYLFELCSALKCCKNLRDFRIEQPNILVTDRLFMALQRCPLIERVCVISTENSRLSSESSVINLVSGAPKLVFLYIWLFRLTQVACRQIRRCISERYVYFG
ncbi:hypothetical protein B7P43_G17201 [Cryptotermes secundus]|uniref:F-box domain-containing protein n=1 Tax=Cryptotermes secundus TaxID=105785 RepID=A0A2J7REK2_9NEOP|nr:hypothetical protein B7P43_G17201 [Cryptotermes secundus]